MASRRSLLSCRASLAPPMPGPHRPARLPHHSALTLHALSGPLFFPARQRLPFTAVPARHHAVAVLCLPRLLRPLRRARSA